jgi:PAS domain S-box-containing protein
MKVRTKLYLSVALLFLVFGATFIFYGFIQREGFVELFRLETQEKEKSFDKIAVLKGKVLEALVFDYSYWDEMVSFIETGNKAWAKTMMDTSVLSNYNINVIWVYRLDRTLAYAINQPKDAALAEIPLNKEILSKLFLNQPLRHFFVNTPSGLLEIRGATVHPTADVKRETPARGYLFAARLWDKEYVDELAKLSGGEIQISPAEEKELAGAADPEQGVITFLKTLPDWKGAALMRVSVRLVSNSLEQFNRILKQRLIFFSAFSVIILLLVLFILTRWVTVPLRSISLALNSGNPRHIDYLKKNKDEFAGISRLIENFLKQREKLAESEQRYRLLAENASDVIWTADLGLNFTYFSPSAERVFGFTAQELIERGINKLLTPVSLELARKAFAEELTREQNEDKDLKRSRTLEWDVIRKNNAAICTEATVTFIRDASGAATGILGISRDITERKSIENELYRINRALKTIGECNLSLVHAADEPILLHAICHNLVGVGGYRMAWVGFSEQDENKTVRPVAGAGHEDGYLQNLGITWSDSERGRGPTGTAIRTGKVCFSKNLLTDPKFSPWRDEAIKRGYASAIAFPLLNEGMVFGALNIYAAEPGAFDENEIKMLEELAGDLAYGIIALRMRDEHRRAEEKLKRLFSAVEQTADIVIITNKDGAIEYVNPAFEKVTGYTGAEAAGQTPRILKSGKHDKKFYENLWKIVLSGQVFREILINKKKNGQLYYAEKTITPIRDKEGNITYFVSTDKDVTERKEVEKTQRLAQLGELVADMAHEVNNPLMIISGNAQISLMEEIHNDEVKNNLKIIFEECGRAKDIIQRLLKFSRPTKGERKEIDISKSIESVVGIIEHQFKLVNVEIKRNYTPNLPFVFVDDKQMQEVFMNLLNNARDAMPQGGVIEISASAERGFMRVDFKDTGCGMTEEVMKRLFEPFFTTKEKGTGLGLSVCYGIMKSHNGKLWFESEPGKGTTAAIFLPLGGKDNV